MDVEEKEAGTTRNRRSSILKRKSRTKSDEDDLVLMPTAEVNAKSTRRVSFASSNFVKPFVTDPDKNTIWDTTYEEAVNHTDSTKSSQERSERTDLNVTTINSEFMLDDNTNIATIENGKLEPRAENTIFDNNPMEFTRINHTVRSVSEMEITTNVSLYAELNAIDKENLHPDVIADKENIQRQLLYAGESILNYAKTKIQENNDDKENIPFGLPITLLANKNEADDVSCISMDIETEEVQSAPTTGENQKWDQLQESRTMEFTCQLPNQTDVVEDFDTSRATAVLEDSMEFTCHNPQIMQARPMNVTQKFEQNMEFTCQIPQWQQPPTMPDLSTMEFTCQVSQKHIQQMMSTTRNVEQTMNLTCLLPQVDARRGGVEASGMELTCQIPQAHFLNKTESSVEPNAWRTLEAREVNATKNLGQDMELTRQIPQVKEAAKELNETKIAEQNMELTCQIPRIQRAAEELNRTKLVEHNMELTCQIPQIQKAANEFDKTKVAEQNMELTCQIPQIQRAASELNRTKTVEHNMELTCQIPQIQQAANEFNKTKVAEQNMELTCQIPQIQRAAKELNRTQKVEQNMELTCQIPQIQQAANEFNKTKVAEQNMELTCQNPRIQKAANEFNKTKVVEQNMELTCQIPQIQRAAKELNKTQKVEQNMELTCQIPQIQKAANEFNKTKLADQNMELTCQIPQSVKLFNRTNLGDQNMEFTCQMPGTQPARQNVDLEQQSMELTCQKQMPQMNITQKLHENMEFTRHRISQAPNPDSSKMVQENLEFILQNPHIKVQPDLEKSNMELTCQVTQTRIQKLNETKCDGVEQKMESTSRDSPTVQPCESNIDLTCPVSQKKSKSDQTAEQKPRLAPHRKNVAYCKNERTVEPVEPSTESTCNNPRNDSECDPNVVRQKHTMFGSTRIRRNREWTSNAVKSDFKIGLSTGDPTENTLAEFASTRKVVGDEENSVRSGIARLQEKSPDNVENAGSTDPVDSTKKVVSPACEEPAAKNPAAAVAADHRLLDIDEQTESCDILRRDLHHSDSSYKLLELTRDHQIMAVKADTLLSKTVAMDMSEVEVGNAAVRNVPEAIPDADVGCRTDGNRKTSEEPVSDVTTTTSNLVIDIEVPKPSLYHSSDTTTNDGHTLSLPEDKPPKTTLPMDSMVTTTDRTFTGNNNNNEKELMKTPEPSFHINLTGLSSCTDDTQQLIHYTFSKQPGSCNLLPSFKESNNTISCSKNPLLISLSQTDDGAHDINVTAPNLEDNSTTTANNIDLDNISVRLPKNRLTSVNDTYVLKKLNSNCQDSSSAPNPPDVDSSDLIFSNDSMIELVPAHDDSANSPNHSSTSAQANDNNEDDTTSPTILNADPKFDYPLTRKALEKLELKPLKLQTFDLAASTVLLQQINGQREEIVEYLKNFEYRFFQVPDSIIPCVQTEEQNSECGGQMTSKEDIMQDQQQQQQQLDEDDRPEQAMEQIELSSTSSTDDNSIIKRIEEAEGRCDGDWKLDKYEFERCYFSTLCGTLIFIVDIEMISGIVSNIETEEDLEGVADPLASYLNRYLARKLKHDSLCSALGHQYDVFSLLDYIQMNVVKIQRFCEESKELIKNGVVWERDIMKFEVHNYNLIVLLQITVDMNKLESLEEDDVQVEILIGKIRDSYIYDIKKLAESCPKGLDFFMSYPRKIEEYLVQKEKYLRSKKV